MRTSLVLLAALAACSDSNGPRQIPALLTQVSTYSVPMYRQLAVTLTASNPTDTTLHVAFEPGTFAEIKLDGKWSPGPSPSDGFVGQVQVDTLSLDPGAASTLGVAYVTFYPPGGQPSGVPTVYPSTQAFPMSPGTYSIRACYYPWRLASPQGGVSQAQCGNALTFALTS
jgi:hypothetical protein